MQINFSLRQLSWSFSSVVRKCVGMSSLLNKSEIVFLFTKPIEIEASMSMTKPYLKEHKYICSLPYLQLFLQLPFT